MHAGAARVWGPFDCCGVNHIEDVVMTYNDDISVIIEAMSNGILLRTYL